MFEFVHEFLSKIGYTHPPHPALLHVPMGMMIGAFLLALAALVLRRPGPGAIGPPLCHSHPYILCLVCFDGRYGLAVLLRRNLAQSNHDKNGPGRCAAGLSHPGNYTWRPRQVRLEGSAGNLYDGLCCSDYNRL